MSDFKKAIEAIRELFNDTSVDQDETRRQLEYLIDKIEILVDTLDSWSRLDKEQ